MLIEVWAVVSGGGGDYLPLTGGTVTGDLQVDGLIKARGGTLAFGIAEGIDTRDVLDRAEVATMPAVDDEGAATADAEVGSVTVTEVVTALLAKVKEQGTEIATLTATVDALTARIETLENGDA